MTNHPPESILALFAAGDLRGWEHVSISLHVWRCKDCRAQVADFRADRAELAEASLELPPELAPRWDRLAAEMTANIHLGLAAGECVSIKEPRRQASHWKLAVAAAGVAVVLGSAWWLNMPSRDNIALTRVFEAVMSQGRSLMMADDRGAVVEASPLGIQYVENGAGLGFAARPVATSVSMEGSASAHYVDDETGQVTITTVSYVGQP